MREALTAWTLRRRWQRLGLWLVLLMAIGLLWLLTWRILGVLEMRNMQAMHGALARGLSDLAAERLAAGQPLPEAWLRGNPFQLLRWQPDDYCGSLPPPGQLRGGCWYYLAERGWLAYQARYADRRAPAGDGLYLWQLRRLPEKMQTASQRDDGLAFELQSVRNDGFPSSAR